MPFVIKRTDCSPLVIDHEFEVADLQLLASHVGELLLGNHFHMTDIINELSTEIPDTPNVVINNVIQLLEDAPVIHRDGWLFQMISWLALTTMHAGEKFYTQQPHGAPAHHGLDGLAVLLKPDGRLDKLIICEDKFTDNPRNLIQRDIWPEFASFERNEKDHTMVGIVSIILQHLDSGRVLREVRNDVFNNQHRLYRVSINRLSAHNSDKGRKRLFSEYDECVTGELPRRAGATIYLDDAKQWMKNFAAIVIAYLKSKKANV